MSELVKLLTCLAIVFCYEAGFSWKRFIGQIRSSIIEDLKDCLLISIPGILYTIQNNLLFVAYSYLSAVSFQMSYQLKIFTTAIFFRLLLGRRLNRMQWLALCLLFTGVVLNQTGDFASNPTPSNNATSTDKSHGADNNQSSLTLKSLALSSVVVACACSGFAGVYLEKMLKSSKKSLAIRNIQLAFYGITAGLLGVWFKDGHEVSKHGFFFAYDAIVWASVLIQSLGGLIIAATMQYADNILKGFATSIAIVLTFVISLCFFAYRTGPVALLGALLVIGATLFYSYHSTPPPSQSNNHSRSSPPPLLPVKVGDGQPIKS